MGVVDAFDSLQADFTGITPSQNLWVLSAVQKTHIAVDEEGTVAAGATGVAIVR